MKYMTLEEELAEEWREDLELGFIVEYDNGLQGMANGPEWCRVPLCNDGWDIP